MFNENHQEDYDVEEWSVEKDIQRKQRISRKGKKHVKDCKPLWEDATNKMFYAWDGDLYYYIKGITHKHKRAERVYTSEECELYYDWTIGEGGDYSDDFYNVGSTIIDDDGFCCCEFCIELGFLLPDQSLKTSHWENELLDISGLYMYSGNYNWNEELRLSCNPLDRKHTSQMCNIKLYLLRACLKEGE